MSYKSSNYSRVLLKYHRGIHLFIESFRLEIQMITILSRNYKMSTFLKTQNINSV